MKKNKPILMLYCLLLAVTLSGCSLQNAARQIGQEIRAQQESGAESGFGEAVQSGEAGESKETAEIGQLEEMPGGTEESGETAAQQTAGTTAGRYVYTTLDGTAGLRGSLSGNAFPRQNGAGEHL